MPDGGRLRLKADAIAIPPLQNVEQTRGKGLSENKLRAAAGSEIIKASRFRNY
jgi:hypothetical protein